MKSTAVGSLKILIVALSVFSATACSWFSSDVRPSNDAVKENNVPPPVSHASSPAAPVSCNPPPSAVPSTGQHDGTASNVDTEACRAPAANPVRAQDGVVRNVSDALRAGRELAGGPALGPATIKIEDKFACNAEDPCIKGIAEQVKANPRFAGKSVIFKLNDHCPNCEDDMKVQDMFGESGAFHDSSDKATLAQMFWRPDLADADYIEKQTKLKFPDLFKDPNPSPEILKKREAATDLFDDQLFSTEAHSKIQEACKNYQPQTEIDGIKMPELPLLLLFDKDGSCKANYKRGAQPEDLQSGLSALLGKPSIVISRPQPAAEPPAEPPKEEPREPAPPKPAEPVAEDVPLHVTGSSDAAFNHDVLETSKRMPVFVINGRENHADRSENCIYCSQTHANADAVLARHPEWKNKIRVVTVDRSYDQTVQGSYFNNRMGIPQTRFFADGQSVSSQPDYGLKSQGSLESQFRQAITGFKPSIPAAPPEPPPPPPAPLTPADRSAIEASGPFQVSHSHDSTFEQDVVETSKQMPVLVIYGHDRPGPGDRGVTCPNCEKTRAAIETIMRNHPEYRNKVKIVEIDVDDDPKMARKYFNADEGGVLPLTRFFSNGVPVGTYTGHGFHDETEYQPLFNQIIQTFHERAPKTGNSP